MKRWYRCFSLAFMLPVILFSCMSRKSEPVAGKSFTPANEHIRNGEQKFNMYCQKCHPGGEGGLGPALNSNPAPGFIKRFQVRHGLGVMPSFKKNEIAKQDVKDIAKYLKALKHF
jgi:mono/diheme cytochrome c family protein